MQVVILYILYYNKSSFLIGLVSLVEKQSLTKTSIVTLVIWLNFNYNNVIHNFKKTWFSHHIPTVRDLEYATGHFACCPNRYSSRPPNLQEKLPGIRQVQNSMEDSSQ